VAFAKPNFEALKLASEAVREAPKLEGVPTGVPGLDELFFITEFKGDKPVTRPLPGFPRYAAIHVTGVSDTGKSLLAEQFTLAQAERGEGVIFVTVEVPANFVSVGLEQRRQAMRIDKKAMDHVLLVDAASHDELREDLPSLLSTLDVALGKVEARHLVVDSLTGLYEAKEIAARALVRKLYAYTKDRGLTAIFTSQKRSGHEELSAEAAGGYVVSHVMDATLVLAKKLVMSTAQAKIWKKPIGELVRFFRIDGSRMCGHDSRTHFMEITPEGLLVVGPPVGGEEA